MNKRINKKRKTLPVKQIKTIHINKGDIVVIESNIDLDNDQIHDIADSLSKMFFPNNKVLVVPNGLKMEIISEGCEVRQNPNPDTTFKILTEEEAIERYNLGGNK